MLTQAISQTTPTPAALFAVLGAIAVALIKGWPIWKKVGLDADGSLRTDLLKRIAELETHVATLENNISAERDRHAAEMSIIRHRLNNETASLDALLLLLEVAPEKLTENIALIKEMRANRANAVALEQGAASAAAAGGNR